MKYILKPFWLLILLLYTLFEICFCILDMIVMTLWHFKLPEKFNEGWKELHTTMTGWDEHGKPVNSWDENISETIKRRLTNGKYKHVK